MDNVRKQFMNQSRDIHSEMKERAKDKRAADYFNWVKRLGQWHLADPHIDSHKTLCGRPMLGNNYDTYIPIHRREKCEDCWKELS